MSRTVVLSFAPLAGENRVGELKKDDKGYYHDMVLGALGAHNAHGAYYHEEAVKLFRGDADLIRRAKNFALRGEDGHPRPTPGMTERQWFQRVADIYEPNICAQYIDIDLSFDSLRDDKNRPVIAIMSKVRPSGAQERSLERQLDNPLENVCFSIRSFTDDTYIGGKLVKFIRKVVTFDKVNEPGFSFANKFSSPSMESLGTADVRTEFSLDMIEKVANDDLPMAVGMESHSIVRDTARDLVMAFQTQAPIVVQVPASYRW